MYKIFGRGLDEPSVYHRVDSVDQVVPHGTLIGLNHCDPATNAHLEAWLYGLSRDCKIAIQLPPRKVMKMVQEGG